MSDWDGNERRKIVSQDHDLLIEIRGDIKHLVGTMNTHIADDLLKFAEIKKDLNFTSKILYMALGIIAFIEFLGKFK